MASSPSPTPSRDAMTPATDALTTHLVHLVRRVQRQLGQGELTDEPTTRFADALDSMGMVEFVAILAGEDPLTAAVAAASDCLREGELSADAVGALLVTSESPPRLAGLAAALHHRLGLRPEAVALEIGNACTGFLAALWAGEALLPRT